MVLDKFMNTVQDPRDWAVLGKMGSKPSSTTHAPEKEQTRGHKGELRRLGKMRTSLVLMHGNPQASS